MDDKDLKACPFCGGMAVFRKTNKRSTRGYACCYECGARTETKYNDREDDTKWKVYASNAWNRRA